MKKLNRKLIPAFAMLLLSAVLMSTASFAWFSSNTTVTATGMKVQATAPAALWISTIGGTKWETNIDLEGDVENMSPVTTNSAQAIVDNWDSWKFYGLNKDLDGHNVYGDVLSDGSVKDQDLTVFPENAEDTAKALVLDTTNFFAKGFRLYLEGDADSTLTVAAKVKVTTEDATADAILACMRVALVAQATDTNAAKAVVLQPTEADKYATEGGNTPGASTVDAPQLVTLTGNVEQQVFVYIWFEGTDSDCINKNSINMTTWNVALEFVPYNAG